MRNAVAQDDTSLVAKNHVPHLHPGLLSGEVSYDGAQLRRARAYTAGPGLRKEREETIASKSERREHERTKEGLAVDVGRWTHRSASSETAGGGAPSPPAKRSSA